MKSMIYSIEDIDRDLLVRSLHTHKLALTQAQINHKLAVAERNKHPLRPVAAYLVPRILKQTELDTIQLELKHIERMLSQLT
jgi:hypothetical protein